MLTKEIDSIKTSLLSNNSNPTTVLGQQSLPENSVIEALEEHKQKQEKANNLIVFGLPEPQNGSPSDKQTEDINKINELYNVMNIAKPSNYEQLFRLGRPRNDRTPRPLLVKFKPEDTTIRRATLINQWRLQELPQTDPLHDETSKIFIHPYRTKK